MVKNFYFKTLVIIFSLLIYSSVTVHFSATNAVQENQHIALSAEEIFTQAIRTTKPIARNSWAYTRTEVTKDVTWVERFDPRDPDVWRLLDVFGDGVTDEILEARKLRYQERLNSDEYLGENNFSKLVKPETLERLADTATQYVLIFQPLGKDTDEAKFMRYVEGKFYINKEEFFIEKMELRNTRNIKPVPIAKIKKFFMQMELHKVSEDIYITKNIHTEISGTAMFKRFEEKSTIKYTDFEFIK